MTLAEPGRVRSHDTRSYGFVGMTLVTGASSEIGRSLARRKELLDSLVGEIEAAGGRALAIACDVTDGEAVPARGA